MSALSKSELYEFVSVHRYGVVATTHADGSAESAFVGIAASRELEIYFDTVGETRKAGNLRRDPRIAMVIGGEDERSVQLEGVADEPKDSELDALKRAGCKKIFIDEGISGATAKRPALTKVIKALKSGDVLVVWRLDRLGRSLTDLIEIINDLAARKIGFRSLSE